MNPGNHLTEKNKAKQRFTLTNFYIFNCVRAMRKLKITELLLFNVLPKDAYFLLSEGCCLLYHMRNLDNLILAKHSRLAIKRKKTKTLTY